MEIYNKLSADYDKLYLENLKEFQKGIKPIWNGDNWFTDFYPSLGIKDKENCDLLFYGQAVNGWRSGFDISNLLPKNKIETSVKASNKFFKGHTPLDWVNVRYCSSVFRGYCDDKDLKHFYSDFGKYWTFRSFFWKVVYKLTSDFYGIDRNSREWAEKAVWSNLYKIAEDGRNPTFLLKELQFVTSVKLLEQEIKELKPKFCIVLTNLQWWLPFQQFLKTTPLKFDSSLNTIVAFEKYQKEEFNTNFIVTTRPRLGSGEDHVRQILSLIL